MASKSASKTVSRNGPKAQSKVHNRRNREERIFSAPPPDSRLSKLEEVLATQSRRVGTPFKHITAISNPGTSVITAYPALQWWFESFRTISKEAINQVVRLQQNVLMGSLIISNRSLETEARKECYYLLEELEDRVMGYMPVVGTTTEVIMPLAESDAAFSQMSQGGLFTLTVLWEFEWIISKGATP